MDRTSRAVADPGDGRTLLAHEWIASIGGSENVFRELIDTFPHADALCLWNDVPDTFGRPIVESRLARGPFRRSKAMSLPLMPWAWRQVPLEAYETVVASSHAFAHHLAGHAAREGKRAFAYVHTPARYIWAPEVEIRGQSLPARLASAPLKRVDRRAAHPGVHYAANSSFVRDRIRRSWDVDADVIYPPVDVRRIVSKVRWRDELDLAESELFDKLPSGGFVLGASRLVSYKRLDLAMEVGEALGLPVVIAGSGPDEDALRSRANDVKVPVHFAGRVTDAQLYALYQEALLFVFLAVEDFGIMPVEAMASGTPALVNGVGGAAESVGALGAGQVVEDIESAASLAHAAKLAIDVDMAGVEQRAMQFDTAAFRDRVATWVTGDDRG